MRRKVSQPKVEYSNPFWEIRHTRADFDGFSKDYFVVELGPRAGIVALREDQVLFTRQYRFLIDDFSWELPGGGVDNHETPEAAAVRECLEETGYRCDDLEKLVEFYPGLDNFNNRTTLFTSRSVQLVAEFRAKVSEVVEISWFPLSEALRMVLTGQILDALTVAGILGHVARSK